MIARFQVGLYKDDSVCSPDESGRTTIWQSRRVSNLHVSILLCNVIEIVISCSNYQTFLDSNFV